MRLLVAVYLHDDLKFANTSYQCLPLQHVMATLEQLPADPVPCLSIEQCTCENTCTCAVMWKTMSALWSNDSAVWKTQTELEM